MSARHAPTGTLIAVCGLHGGAGTTTTALLLAQGALARHGAQRVLVADSDPAGGGLALHAQTASPYGLAELAALRAAGSAPQTSPIATLPDGLRLCAAPPRAPASHCLQRLGDVLVDARSAHAVTVLDAGHLREHHAQLVLPHADLVVWTMAATASPAMLAQLLASPLTRAARHARWVLAVADVGHAGNRARPAQLAPLAPTVHATVLLPRLAGADHDHRAPARDALLGALT